jgi:hypothetical protein
VTTSAIERNLLSFYNNILQLFKGNIHPTCVTMASMQNTSGEYSSTSKPPRSPSNQLLKHCCTEFRIDHQTYNLQQEAAGRKDAEILLVANADSERPIGRSLRQTLTTLVNDAQCELESRDIDRIPRRRRTMLNTIVEQNTLTDEQLTRLIQGLRAQQKAGRSC